MRLFIRFIGILLALTVALLGAVLLYARDANRLKPEIEALITRHSGIELAIDGDLQWQWLPPLTLQIHRLRAVDGTTRVNAERLDLKLDLTAMWEDVNNWRVSALHLRDTLIAHEGGLTHIEVLDLTDFAPREPADLYLVARHDSGTPDTVPLHATMDGVITYFPATDSSAERVTLTHVTLDAGMAKGVCELDLAQEPNPPARLPEAGADDLLPAATLLSINLAADCALSELTLGGETFHDGTVKVTSTGGKLNALLDVRDFLGGSLLTDVDVDASAQPVTWTIIPDAKGVDSQRLMDWTDRRLKWVAALTAGGTVRATGNTEAELARSLNARAEFDGGQGQIDITQLKAQLAQVATLSGRSEKVAGWPDMWPYETMNGFWSVRGEQHELNLTLDNMTVVAKGTYQYLQDQADILANVTIHESERATPFTINPLLVGTPIPVRCTGPSTELDCQLDKAAAQDVLVKALKKDSDSGLRRKLEQKIDEDVPEEYRDTARDILDLIGRALDTE